MTENMQMQAVGLSWTLALLAQKGRSAWQRSWPNQQQERKLPRHMLRMGLGTICFLPCHSPLCGLDEGQNPAADLSLAFAWRCIFK